MNCKQLPIFRYTWPGQKEQYACFEHFVGIKNIANAMGLPLQFIQLSTEEELEYPCAQIIRGEE